jgi:hypothetical protein
MLTPSEEEVDVEVTREDQSQINKFGRINIRKIEIKSELKGLEKNIQDLDDADEAVMLADDTEAGNIKIQVSLSEKRAS